MKVRISSSGHPGLLISVGPARALAALALVALAGFGCEAEAPGPQGAAHAPHTTAEVEVAHDGDLLYNGLQVLDGVAATRAALSSGELQLSPTHAGDLFWRAGLRFETAAGADPRLEYRVLRGGEWSGWAPVELTWHEDVAFNGRIELDAPAERLALRPAVDADALPAAELAFVYTELFPEPLTVREAVAPEPQGPEGRYATLEQGLAPPGFVNLRSAWGARSTSCGGSHTPTYLTVHHTVSPTNDSMSPEARLRQIQAYHIDSNGWCDIGYHFLVSSDGRLWQGRASHDAPGAHVGGHNTNNVGISFMGSFHIDQVPGAMIEGTAPLFAWFRDSYGIPLVRNQRVFGHQEWSGQSTACPGSFLLPRIQEIIDLANGAGTQVDVSVKWQTIAGQDRNFVAAGSSASIFDMLVGQQVVGMLEVRNGVDRPATDDMIVGYWIESPWLRPVDYRIQTDKPSKDGATFVDSDQNGRADNPAPGELPAEGNLRVGAVEPGETVRILFTLEATTYSFGKLDHPDLRGWVKHIGGYYGEQDGWSDTVEHNDAGKQLQAFAQLDIFSRQQWDFDGPDADDVEGWTANGDVDWLAVNLTDHAMAYRASGADPYVASPAWTRIDADVHERVVIRGRQHGGAREAQLFWAHEGEGFAEERSLKFQVPGDGEFDVFELDLAGLPGWNGTITQLRLDAWNGGPFEGAPAWFDVDYLLVADTGVPVTDADADGSPSEVDCNDADPAIHPGAAEVCDGLDNDCNGESDEAGACTGGDTSNPGDDTDVSVPDATGSDTSDGTPDAVDPDGSGGTDAGGDATDTGGPLAPTDASGGCCAAVRVGPAAATGGEAPWPLGAALGLLGALGLVLRRRRR